MERDELDRVNDAVLRARLQDEEVAAHRAQHRSQQIQAVRDKWERNMTNLDQLGGILVTHATLSPPPEPVLSTSSLSSPWK